VQALQFHSPVLGFKHTQHAKAYDSFGDVQSLQAHPSSDPADPPAGPPVIPPEPILADFASSVSDNVSGIPNLGFKHTQHAKAYDSFSNVQTAQFHRTGVVSSLPPLSSFVSPL